MIAYFIVAASFAVLGIYVFALFRWWRRRLTSLASQFDVSERRRRASRLMILVILMLHLPVITVLVVSIVKARVDGFFLIACILASLAPGAIWYLRQIPYLRALGYYGGQGDK